MKKLISFMLIATMIFSMGTVAFADSKGPENLVDPMAVVDIIDIEKHGYVNESINVKWNALVAGSIELRALTTWIETWEVDEYGIKRRLISKSTPKIKPSTCEYDYYMLPSFDITILSEDKTEDFYSVKYRVESVEYGGPMTGKATIFSFY